jgi:hypothetical protein
MEVKLDKRYPVQAKMDQAWAVLSDIRATAGCMPGAQLTEQLDDTHYKGTVKSKVGPAVMTFNGEIEVLAKDTAGRQLRILGKGADQGGSSAAMELVAHLEPGAESDGCVLVGQATITVSGKLAQFGSRLLVPVSDAMLAQFADNFRAAAQAVPVGSQQVAELGASADAHATAHDTSAIAKSIPPDGAQAQTPNEINVLALVWTVFKRWVAGFFGKKI